MRICACVVLYNPDETVITNILSYLGLVERLFIIDNSSEITASIETQFNTDHSVEYVFLGGNKGIATALNKACNIAYDLGFDWILTMDQDSRFEGREFFEIFLRNAHNDGIGIFAASYTDVFNRWKRSYNIDFDELHFAITSGNLVRLDLWRAVRGFDEKLFIDEVDHDFCLKLRLAKHKILTTKKILLQHSVGLKASDIGEPKKRYSSRPAPLRTYYITRNGLLMMSRYLTTDFAFVLNRAYNLAKSFLRIILIYPEKRQYLKYYFKGVRHFCKSRYGKM